MLIYIVILIISVILHELAHGYTAYSFGDPTAKDLGRLSPNPIKHIDPVGSLLVPFLLVITGSSLLFGWAKKGQAMNPQDLCVLLDLEKVFPNLLLLGHQKNMQCTRVQVHAE